jgi:hypothetical protein
MTVVVMSGQAHVEPLVDVMLHNKTKGKGVLVFENFLQNHL